MNEVLEQVAKTRAAQKSNGLPTPDELKRAGFVCNGQGTMWIKTKH